jgi:short subunit dehydrogenase-like uncharacterized protein
MDHREFDVILYGATGFVGRQATRYLALHAPPNIRWAISGRSRTRLEALNAGVPILCVDSTDFLQAEALTRRTRVLLSTAGPFALYSDRLVEACVKNLTHYVDITGELAWVQSLIERFHERAERDGTRIIPFCGFGSVPADLGVAMLTHLLGPQIAEVRAYFELRNGPPNSGSIASVCHMYDSGDDALLEPAGATAEPGAGGWVVSMPSSLIDSRVVVRSASLTGVRFAFHEFLLFRGLLAPFWAHGAGAATRALHWILRQATLRKLLLKLARPGAGPTERQMDNGYFRCRMLGWAHDGARAVVTLAGEGDPSNRVTVKCVCESALAIACGSEKLPARGGVLTPSTGIGDALLERLKKSGIIITAGMM